MECFTGHWRANSSLNWPEQPKPPAAAFSAFRTLLKRAFSTRNLKCRNDRDIPLDHCLGKWLKTERHVIDTVYRNDEFLFIRNDTDPSLLSKYREDSLGNHWNLVCDDCDYLPKNSHPCLARVSNGRIYCDYQYAFLQPIISQPTDDTRSLHPQQVYDADKLYLVSDASLHPITSKAAYEWVLSTTDRSAHIKRCAPSRTNPRYTSTFRAELDGINNGLQYCDDKGLNSKSITIYCDNLEVIRALGGDANEGDGHELCPRPPNHLSASDITRYAESALLQSTVSLLKKFPNAKVCHLYGHQDKQVAYENLNIPTQLNVDCDLGAKKCMRESEIDTTRPVPVAGSRAVFFLGSEMVTSNIKEQIQYANQAPAMAQYIKDKFEWTDNQYTSVNWKANGIGMKRLPLRQAI
jgi:ribonuclease HI